MGIDPLEYASMSTKVAHRAMTFLGEFARAALACTGLALLAPAAGAAPPPESPAALTFGDYPAGQAGNTAAAVNQRAKLTVSRFRVSANLGAQQAPAHHAYLTVGTEWRIMGAVQYLVPQMNNHLFLLIDGDRQVTMSDATAAAPHPLPIEQLLVPSGGSAVGGDAVFEIPDHGVASLELLFIDSDQGNMSLPLFGRAPPEPHTVAGPVGDDLMEISVLGMK